jgi:hypothetical protein
VNIGPDTDAAGDTLPALTVCDAVEYHAPAGVVQPTSIAATRVPFKQVILQSAFSS